MKLLCTILSWWIRVITFVQTDRTSNTKSEPSRKLWTLSDNEVSVYVHHLEQMYHLEGDVDSGETARGAGGIWEISVPSVQFRCEPKTALYTKVYRAPNAGVLGSIPGQGTRSRMAQLRSCVPQLGLAQPK